MSAATDWQAAARDGRIGHRIEAHASIGSTNDRARELLAADPSADGIVVVAEEQTAGRGRRGRSWISPPGVNLTASVALRPAMDAGTAWQLGLGGALAAREACAVVVPVWLKWPNDVVSTDELKLGGLLVETAVEAGRLTEAVIGVGINVNWRRAEMPDDVRSRATSLAELSGAAVDRIGLLARLLDALEREVESAEAGGSPLERYRAACSTLGAEVEVETAEEIIRGVARSVDPGGALVVATVEGARAISNGEVVHVRPVGASR